MPKYLVNLDLAKNELQNARLHNLAAAPSNPVEGQIYQDTAQHAAYVWNGSAWRPVDPAKLTDGTIPNGALTTNPLARANHTGTQLAATISDFDTQVRTNRLDQLAVPTADVSLNARKLTNVATPVSGTDAANKQYVDDVVAAISWKNEVRAATTAAGTLASSFANGSTIDGVTLATGDRILIKNQAAAAENGLYTVNASGAPTRATDADTGAELAGAALFVTAGTANAGKRFVCNVSGTITLGTTPITWVQFDGGVTYTAGNGLTLIGADFAVGQGAGLIVSADAVSIDSTVVAAKYSASIGNGVLTSIAVTHGLGTQDVVTAVREVSTNAVVYCDVVNTDANTVTLSFATAPTANQYRVTCVG